MFSFIKHVYDVLSKPKINYEEEMCKAIKRLEDECEQYKANNLLEDASSNNKDEEAAPTKSNCFEKTGKITAINAEHGVIDDIYIYTNSAARSVQGLEVGCRVLYLAYKHSDEFPVKIVKIEAIVGESWDPNEKQTQEVLDELKDAHKEYFNFHQRSVLGLVVERRKSLISVNCDNNDTIDVDLECVQSQFVPYVGDRVYLNCRVQSDMSYVDMAGEILEVININPARSSNATGKITQINLNQKSGVVNQKYFFWFDALASGYIVPEMGDLVSVDAIESEQDKFQWRCINVVCTGKSEQPETRNNNGNHFNDVSLQQNKNGIEISQTNKFEFSDLDEKKTFSLFIKNTSQQRHKVLRCIFMSTMASSQIRLIDPRRDTQTFLEPDQELCYHFKICTKFFGKCTETLIFSFGGNFKISRNIEIDVVDTKYIGQSMGTGVNLYKNKAYTHEVWNRKVDYVPGIKSVRAPKFIAHKILHYDVPITLKTIVLKYNTTDEINEKLDQCLNFFQAPLTITNYEMWFHNLLYLEEIEMFHSMRRYDKDRAHFIREQEYLALQMDGISESRPSLVLGDSIRASNPWAPVDDQVCYEGFIHKVLNNRILVKFTQTFHTKYNGEDYKLEFYYSRSQIRKMHAAVQKAHLKLGADFLFPSKIVTQTRQLDVELVDGELRRADGKEATWFNPNLNIIQKEAVKNILQGEARPMPYVIFGPPGTGKTITVVETILQICSQLPHSRILVAAPSNSAANLITERIVQSRALLPGEFIRLVGHNVIEREQIPETLLQYCGTIDIAREGTVKDEMLVTESGLKLRLNSGHIGKHRITIGTCSILGSLMYLDLPRDNFTHAIVDESGQCVEPELLIPVIFMNKQNGQIILAGDPMQLGPVVMSPHAKIRGLQQSFLQRLLARFPYQKDSTRFDTGYDKRLITKLLYNYRSLPSILKLYSEMFYDNELISMVDKSESDEAKLLVKMQEIVMQNEKGIIADSHGIFFVGIRGENRQCQDSPSWFNSEEAKSIFYFVLRLYVKKMKSADIGIISPYIEQTRVIRNLLKDADLQLPKIGTVEEFQGQERHIILISTVRSSVSQINRDKKHLLGFISHPNRMNVAISRARSTLIVFGNPHILSLDPCWKQLLKYCIQNNAYVGCDLPASLTQNIDDC